MARKSASKPQAAAPVMPVTSMTKQQLVQYGELGDAQRTEAGLELYRRAFNRAHKQD